MARKEIMQEIVAREAELLMNLRTEEPVAENTIPAFKKMREMTYCVLSDATITSWLEDLRNAVKFGRNPLMEKYALVGGQIPHLKKNPLIKQIVAIEVGWMQEIAAKYPKMIKREQASAELFEKYALCELQTWGDRTIGLYWQDVQNAVKEGRNFAEDRYNWLYRDLGKGNLQEVELGLSD